MIEVEGDRVLNRYAEVFFDCRNQLGKALEQPGIDLVGPGAAGVGDEEVAGNGEDRQAVVLRIGVEDHDHVAVHAVDPLRAQSVGQVLMSQGAARG